MMVDVNMYLSLIYYVYTHGYGFSMCSIHVYTHGYEFSLCSIHVYSHRYEFSMCWHISGYNQ